MGFGQDEDIWDSGWEQELAETHPPSRASSGMWPQEHGPLVSVTQMSTQHLQNARRLLRAQRIYQWCPEEWRLDWERVFEKELKRRGVRLRATAGNQGPSRYTPRLQTERHRLVQDGQALGLRALEKPFWQWEDLMLFGIQDGSLSSCRYTRALFDGDSHYKRHGVFPILGDAVTRALVLERVRKVLGNPGIYVAPTEEGLWVTRYPSGVFIAQGASEAEALVEALG